MPPSTVANIMFSMAFFVLLLLCTFSFLVPSERPFLLSKVLHIPLHSLTMHCTFPVLPPSASLVPLYLHLSPLAGSIPICPVMSSSSIWHPRPCTSKPHSKLLAEGRQPQQSPFSNSFLQQSSRCHLSCKLVDTDSWKRTYSSLL